MKKPMAILLLFLPWVTLAQVSITGKVINAVDKKPVPFASVFLSNTVVGAKTNDDGTFTLNNVKNGQYDLVISFIGFETRYQHIVVNDKAIALDDILILQKTTTLKEVKIGPPDANRAKYLAVFTREFLGRSPNATDCKIQNIDVLEISYNTAEGTLNASSDEYLVVENKALGYKIKYQVNKFIKNYHSNLVYYEGPALFEEMTGKPSQQRDWSKKRLNTYKGSAMHFLRSIFSNQLTEEGFRELKLMRKNNPARPPDSVIRAKMRKYSPQSVDHPDWKDSASYWREKLNMPRIMEYLATKPLALDEFVKRTDAVNMLALAYTDYLYVIYTQKKDNTNNNGIYHPLDMPNYPSSVLTLNAKFAVFDRNGIFVNPASTTVEGAWGVSAVADLLPVDYEPKP